MGAYRFFFVAFFRLPVKQSPGLKTKSFFAHTFGRLVQLRPMRLHGRDLSTCFLSMRNLWLSRLGTHSSASVRLRMAPCASDGTPLATKRVGARRLLNSPCFFPCWPFCSSSRWTGGAFSTF